MTAGWRTWGYRLAIALILLGVLMLCQPFAFTLYTWGFPVVLAGVALFLVLDHLPQERRPPPAA